MVEVINETSDSMMLHSNRTDAWYEVGPGERLGIELGIDASGIEEVGVHPTIGCKLAQTLQISPGYWRLGIGSTFSFQRVERILDLRMASQRGPC